MPANLKGLGLALAVVVLLWWLHRSKPCPCESNNTPAKPDGAPPPQNGRIVAPESTAPAVVPTFVAPAATLDVPRATTPQPWDLCIAGGGQWTWDAINGGQCVPAPPPPSSPVSNDYSGLRRQQCEATGGFWQEYPDYMGGAVCSHVPNGPSSKPPVSSDLYNGGRPILE